MSNAYEDIPADLAREALMTQGACNAGGLVHSLHRAVERLQAERRGTEWLNRHPVLVLYVTQLAHLCGSESNERYREAVAACEAASGEKLV